MSNYGTITPVDIAHSYSYAYDQINKMKCLDAEIINKICEGTQCLQWKDNESIRIWPKPCKKSDIQCKTNSDCYNVMGAPLCQIDPERNNNKYCSYCPKPVTSGHCHINNKETCNKYSTLPYICNDKTCEYKSDKIMNNLVYTEWQPITCNENKVCVNNQKCINGKCACNDDNDCAGNGKCINKLCEGNQCIIGNFMLREWCENPQSRCEPDKNGNYPAICNDSSDTRGITNISPFYYNTETGGCYMTRDYCKDFGVDYNKGTCKKDADCDTNEKCILQKDGNSYCTGPTSECKIPAGQTIGEMFIGKTIFRWFKSNASCPNENIKEKFENDMKNQLQLLFKQFNNFPEKIKVLADNKYMKNKIITASNFAGTNIHLYLIEWNNKINKSEKIKSGFDADEIQKIFPELIKIENNKKYIIISKKDIGNDNRKKRIYLTLNSSNWISHNIFNALNNSKASKKK